MKYQTKKEVEASFDRNEVPKMIKEFIPKLSYQWLKEDRHILRIQDLDALIEHCEGMKRTDETQMHEDHIYDEALSDMISHLKELKKI